MTHALVVQVRSLNNVTVSKINIFPYKITIFIGQRLLGVKICHITLFLGLI